MIEEERADVLEVLEAAVGGPEEVLPENPDSSGHSTERFARHHLGRMFGAYSGFHHFD